MVKSRFYFLQIFIILTEDLVRAEKYINTSGGSGVSRITFLCNSSDPLTMTMDFDSNKISLSCPPHLEEQYYKSNINKSVRKIARTKSQCHLMENHSDKDMFTSVRPRVVRYFKTVILRPVRKLFLISVGMIFSLSVV